MNMIKDAPPKPIGEQTMNTEIPKTSKRDLPSGRWILTLISGVCLLMLTFSLCLYGGEKSISGEAIAAIITAVFTSYFNKDRNNGKI
jgi:hypothetical protein